MTVTSVREENDRWLRAGYSLNERGWYQLARIERVDLGHEDHGVLTLNLVFDFGSAHQGTGHYGLCPWTPPTPERDWQQPDVAHLIRDLLKAVGVGDWSQLVGSDVRVYYDAPHGDITGFCGIRRSEPFSLREWFLEHREPEGDR